MTEDRLHTLARECNLLLRDYKEARERERLELPHPEKPEEIWEKWLKASRKYHRELTKRSNT